MNPLFDFSDLREGQKLTRVIYNLWVNSAEVLEFTERTLVCLVLVDGARAMTFDRLTGVCVQGQKFGLLVNRCGQGREFVQQLKSDLIRCLESKGELLPETAAALRQQLAHDW